MSNGKSIFYVLTCTQFLYVCALFFHEHVTAVCSFLNNNVKNAIKARSPFQNRRVHLQPYIIGQVCNSETGTQPSRHHNLLRLGNMQTNNHLDRRIARRGWIRNKTSIVQGMNFYRLKKNKNLEVIELRKEMEEII